ncbi:type II toxin-antitoxin system RnlB family antitoxin [Clostridium sp. AWRP]|uniref:type II toxin-antitoxin system RnlB family antitoxin n=1 Tax=Clostridium sp. AWRP TaxID=2212991 RepID=UPI000FD9472D|nr:type II toxin-antitoxin system RnlB family antitoxin [Clostridium sp. AWRP]AZV58935.1 type II toxin-antitoxin system RnlB family antitoxin [Clostridium sp. AWRP]
MKLFKIFLLEEGNYSALIVLTSCESPSKFVDQIAEELIKKEVKGKILLDTLMHSGNSDERFISVYFDGKSFLDDTFEFVQIKKNSQTRKQSASYFKECPEIVEYSILNSFQKRLLLKGCGI